MTGASGPKSVVIVIDKSGSMGQNNRMKLAREASVSVIDGLGIND